LRRNADCASSTSPRGNRVRDLGGLPPSS
jgi:hypothetical protein